MKNLIFILFYLVVLLVISCNEKQSFDYPIVYTKDVTDITDTSAMMNAEVIALGDDPIVESGFILGLYPNDKNSFKFKNEAVIKDFFALKTNVKLLPEMTYYVRAYIKNEYVTTYGNEVSFESDHGQTDIGSWYQEYSEYVNNNSCDFITTSFIINERAYFTFENGDLYSYDFESKTFHHEVNNTILSTANFSVVYKSKVYIYSNNTIYLYSPEKKSFSTLSTLHESDLKYGVSGFLVDDNIYLGCGWSSLGDYSKDFFKYNITGNSWEKIASFQGEYRAFAFTFVLNDKGYVGGGFNLISGQWPYPKFNDLWCYEPETNQWIQKKSLPLKNEELFDLQASKTINFAYCFYKNELYRYNIIFDFWEKMADLEIERELCQPHMFTSNGKIYILESKEETGKKYFNMWRYEK